MINVVGSPVSIAVVFGPKTSGKTTWIGTQDGAIEVHEAACVRRMMAHDTTKKFETFVLTSTRVDSVDSATQLARRVFCDLREINNNELSIYRMQNFEAVLVARVPFKKEEREEQVKDEHTL